MSYTLTPLPPTSWRVAAAQLAPEVDHWYWADLDGAHWSPGLPEAIPDTTHVWGWRVGSRWVRLRVDGETTLGAVLTDGGSVEAEAVEVHRWSADDGRVSPQWSGPMPTAAADLTLYLVNHPHRLTFIELAG